MSLSKHWPLAVAVLAFAWGFSCHSQRVGAYKAEITRLERETAKVDTLYRTDTLTLTKLRRVTDSVLTTDTLWRSDTVRVLIASERHACNQVIETCEQRVAVRDSLIKALKKKPSVLSKLPWILGGVVVGSLLK